MRRPALLLPLLLALLNPLGWAGCSKPAQNADPEQPVPQAQERCARGLEPLPAGIRRGVSLAHNYQHGGRRGYGTPTSAASLRELKALGVQSVSLTPFGFMRGLDDQAVHGIEDVPAAETDARVRREIRAAKDLGLRVFLKPQLWVVGGAWRGRLDPGSPQGWDQWFASYEAWLLHYADLAQSEGVDQLAIGVELKSTEQRFEERWREIAKKVRARFDGEIVYCANWDDVDALPWWDAVDSIGVQFYPPLAEGSAVDEAGVRGRLDAAVAKLKRVSERTERPVLFSEVGYRSAKGSLAAPHQWPERVENAEADQEVQALAYRLFVEAVRAQGWVRGIYWWKWFTDPKTAEEGPNGFSPRGKSAEAVLRSAYGGNCEPAPSALD